MLCALTKWGANMLAHLVLQSRSLACLHIVDVTVNCSFQTLIRQVCNCSSLWIERHLSTDPLWDTKYYFILSVIKELCLCVIDSSMQNAQLFKRACHNLPIPGEGSAGVKCQHVGWHLSFASALLSSVPVPLKGDWARQPGARRQCCVWL